MSSSGVHWLIAIFAYLVGSFPTGVILSRFRFGIDIREIGSGNIGATNIFRVFGFFPGFITFSIDFLKGWLPVVLIQHFCPKEEWLPTIVGVAAVFGHCFSLFLGFRGGKGVATSFGCVVASAPIGASFLALFSYGAGLFYTRISAVGSLCAVITLCTYLAFLRPGPALETLFFSCCGFIVIKHRSNLARMFQSLRMDSASK